MSKEFGDPKTWALVIVAAKNGNVIANALLDVEARVSRLERSFEKSVEPLDPVVNSLHHLLDNIG